MGTISNTNNKRITGVLLLIGFLVGTLDIVAAIIDYYIASGKGPGNVLRYIASGVFGNTAFKGSAMMIGWGLLFHYIIAVGFTVFFYWLYKRVTWISEHPFLSGIFYGIFMWMTTTRIIIPLSKIPAMPFHGWKSLKAIGILVAMIGWPLAYLMRAFMNQKERY